MEQDAHEVAMSYMEEGGYIEDSQADCESLPCPRELDSWSGVINAYRVYDASGEEIAVIGYWE